MITLKTAFYFFSEHFAFNRLSYFIIGLILTLPLLFIIPPVEEGTLSVGSYQFWIVLPFIAAHALVVYFCAIFLVFDAFRQYSCYGISHNHPILNRVVSVIAIALPALAMFVHPIFLSCSFYLLAYSFYLHDAVIYKTYVMNGSLFLLYTLMGAITALFI